MYVYPVDQYLNTASFLIRVRRCQAYDEAKEAMGTKPEYIVFGFLNSVQIDEFEQRLNEIRDQFNHKYFYDKGLDILWLESFEDAVLLRLC